MKLGKSVLASLILFAVATAASGQALLVQDFVSDGSVDIEAYFDDTNVTIYAASLEALSEVETLALGAGESKAVALPEGNYALESNNPVRVLGQPAPEQQKLVVTPTSATAQSTIQSDPVPPAVYAAPWKGSLRHEVYNGKRARLKAVATQGTAAITEYKWDLSDGDTTGWVAYSGRNMDLDHVFPDGVSGQPWSGTITVKDASGFTASDVYNIVVRPESLDTKRNIAIDDGLWYLHKAQAQSSSGGVRIGHWNSGRNNYYVGATAISLEAFFNNGHLYTDDDTNPYADTVRRGMHYLCTRLVRYNLPHAVDDFNTDMNSNDYGLACYANHINYESGVAGLAFGGSRTPDVIAPIGPAEASGRTFAEIAQDICDFLASSQADSRAGWAEGGWRYGYQSTDCDMSVTQWPVLAMQAMESNFSCIIDARVKSRMIASGNYLLGIQNSNGGFGYQNNSNWLNIAKTGAGIACLKWAGVPSTDDKITRAKNFIDGQWTNTAHTYTNIGDLYAMYGVMKAARLTDPQIATFGTHDWYDEYSNWLTSNQVSDGRWDSSLYVGDYLGAYMRTAMGVLILTPAVFDEPPTAFFTFDPNPADIDDVITFNGSGSSDPDDRPLTYSWEFGDGETGTGMIVTHSYSALASYPVTLTVANDKVPPLQGTLTLMADITAPNHRPTSVPGGPYSGTIGPSVFPPVTLDGSASYDTNEPVDHITKYEWELDNDFPYDFDEGNTPITQYVFEDAGTYDIALRVTDDPDTGYPNAGLTHTVWTTVEITLDDTPPEIACPDDLTLECPADTGPAGTGTATATDACGEVTITHDDSVVLGPGSTETITRTWMAADECDNSASCVQTIEVVDVTPPIADAGADVEVEQESHSGTEVELTGSATDTCEPDLDFAWYEGDTLLGNEATLVHTFNFGAHTVTLEATDDSGNVGKDTTTVTVIDTILPEVSCAVAVDSLWSPNHRLVDVGFTFSVSDICDPDPEVEVTVTSDEATATALGAGGVEHAPDAVVAWNDDGTCMVMLRAERSGVADGRVYVVTITATDNGANQASSSCTVVVDHSKGKGGAAVDSGQIYDATIVDGETAADLQQAGIRVSPHLLPGDANLDCNVNVLDLVFVRNRLRKFVSNIENWGADVNGNGNIDILDLIYTRRQMGSACGKK